ncbi:ferredoxin--NADP reductase [Shewanella intestini]|uniref:ferredoxin--NADP(+) reductase n=1 Tax=Shewanella intestini TaxID=2017544 RepID=A0ABS5I6C5_9GAMM|nr:MULTISPECIES: ferredoxin--NADP reductase [Shewanella]MBR9729393.1 ferredoxin--NADP reductase [Shewanella intestini]MRG37473.1 ferredoxin--NADP(+) reductase [Shewanella sp. XMDDZSB0408]
MWTTGKVVSKTQWNDKLFSLGIRADIAPYLAGQFIKLSQVKDDKRIARAYSLVNSPDSPYLEVLAVAVEDGALSPNLQQLQIGDDIDVSTKATGFMTLEEIPSGVIQGENLWLLATGTAVGPFISMLGTSEPWQRFKRVFLVYGARKRHDLAYLEQLNMLTQKYPQQFTIVTCITREANPDGLNCRIPQGLINGAIEQFCDATITADDSQVMICGNPAMITEVQGLLRERGLAKNLRRAPGQITVEKYW